MSEKRTVKIKICGTEYVLKGDSDPQYMQDLASYVDEKMRELGSKPNSQMHRVAILAAFTIADELFKARRALDSDRQRFDQSARRAAQLDLKVQEALAESNKAPEPEPLAMEEAATEVLDFPTFTKPEEIPEGE